MAFVTSYSSRVLLGPLSLSASLRSAGFTATTDMHDVTTLVNAEKVFIPTLSSSSWAFDGPLDVDPTANLPFDILSDNWYVGELPVTYAPAGLAFGSAVILASAIETNFDTTAAVAGGIDWSAGGQTNGPADVGVSLEDGLTAITADGNGTARDNGAATANGGIAQIHVTAFAGLTNNAETNEHSVDGSTSGDPRHLRHLHGLDVRAGRGGARDHRPPSSAGRGQRDRDRQHQPPSVVRAALSTKE